MSLPLVFALFCGVFVVAVLALVVWLIVVGLKDARRDKKSGVPEPQPGSRK